MLMDYIFKPMILANFWKLIRETAMMLSLEAIILMKISMIASSTNSRKEESGSGQQDQKVAKHCTKLKKEKKESI